MAKLYCPTHGEIEAELTDSVERCPHCETALSFTAEEAARYEKQDGDESADCIQGEGLPAHPEMVATYPNGWSMMDFTEEWPDIAHPVPAREKAVENEKELSKMNRYEVHYFDEKSESWRYAGDVAANSIGEARRKFKANNPIFAEGVKLRLRSA